MKRLLFLFLSLSLSLSSFGQTFFGALLEDNTSGFSVTSLTGKIIVFEGNSITYGAGASDAAHRWATLLSSAIGATEDNHGIGGKLLEAGANCSSRAVFDATTIPTYTSSHGLYILALGVNDIGLNDGTHTPAGYKSTMESAIDAVIAKGWSADKILIISAFYFTGYSLYTGECGTVAADDTRALAYAAAALQVAQEKHTYFIDGRQIYISTGNPDALLTSDHIHPNNAGHLEIKNYVYNAILVQQ